MKNESKEQTQNLLLRYNKLVGKISEKLKTKEEKRNIEEE